LRKLINRKKIFESVDLILVMVYTWSFAAATPSFRCKLHETDVDYHRQQLFGANRTQPNEDYCRANMKISVKECQRCYMKLDNGQVEKCRDYLFDRTHHKYTLVEEVE